MEPRRILIVGASGGIGRGFLSEAHARWPAAALVAWARTQPFEGPPGTLWHTVDVTDEATIATAAATLGTVDLAIVATGQLHRPATPDAQGLMPEKTWRVLDGAVMADSFAVNAIGPALVAKHVLPQLPRDNRAVFAALSARVGSISDNRLGGWHSYRAAKAALNQIIKTLAIELAVKHPQALAVGLHPGTVATPLSAPFESAQSATKLFTPHEAASHLLDVIVRLTPADSGSCFDWRGMLVPP